MNRQNRDAEYTMGRTESETERLIKQSHLYDDITRRFLLRCGIENGMHVLDIGSGAGDVALALADAVGQEGSVTGVDVNGDILETAQQRAQEAGHENVQFIAGDAREVDLPGGYDAVVGRLVLMYMGDPTEALRQLKDLLRPNGTAAFQEVDFRPYNAFLHPSTPLTNNLIEWARSVFDRSGARLEMGRELYQTFVDAGLPEPVMHFEAPMGGSADWPGYDFVASSFRSLSPLLDSYGIVSPEELDVDTLADRLRAEVERSKRPFVLPPHITAHARMKA